MTPEQFCYWLQGIVEAGNTSVQPTPQQWTIIKDHLQTVFHKVTPDYTSPNLTLWQERLKRLNTYSQDTKVIC